jgi:hypothetical protein
MYAKTTPSGKRPSSLATSSQNSTKMRKINAWSQLGDGALRNAWDTSVACVLTQELAL